MNESPRSSAAPSEGRDGGRKPGPNPRGAENSLPLKAALGYGIGAGVGTWVAATTFLTVHVLTHQGMTLGGIGVRSVARATVGDFFVSHYGVTDGVIFGVAGVGTVPAPVYYLVPPLVLAGCGRQCASQVTAADAQAAFVNGATITLGYGLIVGLLLAALFRGTEVGIVGLEPSRAVLLGGLVYPIVFGGVGGLLTRL